METSEPLRSKSIAINSPDNTKGVPLFTSKKMMGEAGAKISYMIIYTKDIADLLEKTRDDYEHVAINPFTKYGMGMSLDSFLNLF